MFFFLKETKYKAEDLATATNNTANLQEKRTTITCKARHIIAVIQRSRNYSESINKQS